MPEKTWQDLINESLKHKPDEKGKKVTNWQNEVRRAWIGHTDWSPGSVGRESIHKKVEAYSRQREEEAIRKQAERDAFMIDEDPTKTTWKDFLRPDPNSSVWRDRPTSGVSDFLNKASEEIFRDSERQLLAFYGWTNRILNQIGGNELPYTPGKADWDPIAQDVTEGSDPYHPASKRIIKKFDFAFETNKALTGLIAGPFSLAGVGASLIERPQEAGSTLSQAGGGFVESLNIFDPKASPAVKYGRALNVLFTVIGAGKGIEAGVPKLNTLRAAGGDIKVGVGNAKVKVASVKGAFQKAGLSAAEAAEATRIIDEGLKQVKAETGFELFKGSARSKAFWVEVNKTIDTLNQVKAKVSSPATSSAPAQAMAQAALPGMGGMGGIEAPDLAQTVLSESRPRPKKTAPGQQPSLFDEQFEYAPEDVLPYEAARESANRVYVPRPENIDPSYIEGVPDQAPDQIIEEFVANTTVKTPRNSKKVGATKAGYFDTKTAQIVLKNRADMNTFWHEVGHQGTYLFPELMKRLTPELLEELVTLHSEVLGELKSSLKAREAVAEYVRARVLNPQEAALRAPEFTKVFDEVVPQEFKAQLDIASRKIHKFITKTPIEKISSTIQFIDEVPERGQTGYEEIKEAFGERRSAAAEGLEEFRTSSTAKGRQKLTDTYAPLDEAIAYVLERTNRSKLLPEEDPALLHDRLGYVDNAIKEQLAAGLVDENFNPIAATDAEGRKLVVAQTPEGEYRGYVEVDDFYYEDGQIKKGLHYQDANDPGYIMDEKPTISPAIQNIPEEAFALKQYLDDGNLVSPGISPENLGALDVQGLSIKWVMQPILDMDHYKMSISTEVANRVNELVNRELDSIGASFGEKVDLEAFAKDVSKYAPPRMKEMGAMDSYAVLANTLDRMEVASRLAQNKAFSKRLEGYKRVFDAAEKEIRGRTQKTINSGYGMDRADELAVQALDFIPEEVTQDAVARMSRAVDFGERYRTFSNAILDRAEKAGLIDAATKKNIQSSNMSYIDLGRVMDDARVQYGMESPGLDAFKNQTKKARGSTRKIMDPVYNLVENAVVTMKLAELNEARNAFFDLFRDVDNLDIHSRSALGTVAEKLKTGESSPQTIQVWKDGVKENWLIRDEALYKALKGQTPLKPNMVTNLTKGMKTMITNWLPFLIKNWIRDAGDASIIANQESWLGQVTFAGERRSAKWFAKLLKTPDNELSTHYTLGGAGMAIWSDIDSARSYEFLVREAVGQVIEENMARGLKEDIIISPTESPRLIVKKRSNIGPVAKAQNWWDKAKNASERSPRLSQFELALERRTKEYKSQGMSPKRAKRNAILKASEDVRGIIDFNRGGEWTKTANQYIPFLNAQIQGVTASMNSLHLDLQAVAKGQPGAVGRIAKRTAALAVKFALVEGVVYQWNQSQGMTQDDYDMMPDYQKDFFYNLKLPNAGYLRIPKPYSTAVLQTFGANLATGQLDGDRLKGLGEDTVDSFLPMTRVDDGIPGVVTPLIEVNTNRDFFRQSEIVPTYERDLPLEFRNPKNSSVLARFMTGYLADNPETDDIRERSFGLDIDPRIVDHVLNSYFGSAYKMATTTTDLMENRNYPEKLPRLGNALFGVTTAETVGADPDVRRAFAIAEQNGVPKVLTSKFKALEDIKNRPINLARGGEYVKSYQDMKEAKLNIIRTARELNALIQERTAKVSDSRKKREIIRAIYNSYK